MDFKVSSPAVSAADAMRFADELEQALGEIANGKRKPGRIPMEPMIGLIQFARDTAERTGRARAALYAIGKTLDDSELRQTALDAYEELSA